MDSKKEIYGVEFTEDCRNEINNIYRYISNNLDAEKAAKRLMKRTKQYIYHICIMEKEIIYKD